MNSIQYDENTVQEFGTANHTFVDPELSDIPIVLGDGAGQTDRPNKYKWAEFAGPEGERYLLSLAQQFAPFALWRTWYAAISYQAPDNTCYVGVSMLVDKRRQRRNGLSVGVKERKVYLDLQAMEARGWLTMSRVRKPHTNEDGIIRYYAVTEKDFSGFYATAHDYHLWTHSPEYIEPERENIPLMLADPELASRLIRFENYRRILLCAKPGPKREQADYHATQLDLLQRTYVQDVNEQLNPPANTIAPYRRPITDHSHCGDTSISSTTEEKGSATIRNTKQTTSTLSNPKPKPLTPEIEGAGAAPSKNAKNDLGYTKEELTQDIHKRGAAAAQISAEHYQKLHGGLDYAEQEAARQVRSQADREAERPEREVPVQVIEEVETYARQYDDAHLVSSVATRARKIYATAEQAIPHFNVTLFFALYDEARKAAAKRASTRRNQKGRVTRVPYMLKCLENALFTLEEMVYLRSDYPLYTDYSLYETVEYLRETHKEEQRAGQTTLDYRAWLSWHLDHMENAKEPKVRTNLLMRDY